MKSCPFRGATGVDVCLTIVAMETMRTCSMSFRDGYLLCNVHPLRVSGFCSGNRRESAIIMLEAVRAYGSTVRANTEAAVAYIL